MDDGLAELTLDAVASLGNGTSACLSPVFSRKYLAQARASESILLVQEELASELAPGRRWIHSHASWALAKVLSTLQPQPSPTQSPHAIIDPSATVGLRVDIGPGAILMAGCCVDDDALIGPHAVVYGCARLGKRVTIGAGAVIGRPGFGWARGPGDAVVRMPQLGGVILDDDVEVGPYVTVDAGTLGPTRLGRGCKLDAHVHVGHNVEIGAGTMVAAQTGFAGSARIGMGVQVGGQVGVADHIVVGDGARLAGKSGVIGNVLPSQSVAGYPAVERKRWLRAMAKLMRGRYT